MFPGIFRFADFELDRNVYELRRNGHRLNLERIPLDLLFLLVDQRNRLVTREEIFERIWGKQIFVDTDNAINTAIRKLRRALEDDPDSPKFIETVPARGYRFVAAARSALQQPAPSSETKAALPGTEATQPRSDDALRRKRDQKPGTTVETPTAPAARGASASRTVAEATASIAPTAPSSETKATATRADATQPHTDDASQHKRDQKPGNATETSSCTAGVFPGYVRASARAKSVDVQKMCADPNAPFMVSVRCLVAAAVCSDYPAEKQGRVAQKPSASNRAPSHPVTDTKADTKADTKPQ